MRYSEYRQMHDGIAKKAFFGEIVDAIKDAPQIISQTAKDGTIMLLAGAGILGGGIGYTAAKMTAHGKQDINTVKKEYENERLKADLGYLSAKTRAEYDKLKKAVAPTSARVIN